MKNFTFYLTMLLFSVSCYNAEAQCTGAAGSSYPNWENYYSFGISKIIEDGGYIWTAGTGCLTKCTKGGSFVAHYNITNSPIGGVRDMGKDAYGNLWLVCTSGTYLSGKLIKFDKVSDWQIFTSPNYQDAINRIEIEQSTGNIYVSRQSASGSSIEKFDGCNWTVIASEGGYFASNNMNIQSMTIDINGQLWVTESSSGLHKYKGGSWTSYGYSNLGLGASNVTSDNLGNVWFVYDSYIDNNSKLVRFDINGYDSDEYTIPNGLGGGCLFIDPNSNNKYLSTNEGVLKFDGANWSDFTKTNSNLYSNDIVSITSDSWFGGIFLGNDEMYIDKIESYSNNRIKIGNTPLNNYAGGHLINIDYLKGGSKNSFF